MSGVPCPHCGSDTSVHDSRRTEFLGMRTIRRRRACKGKRCRFRITTVEIIVTTSAHVPDLRRHLENGIRASQAALAILAQLPSKGESHGQ
jgi:transcriptional regulator NrdR family protein